MKIIVGLGNPGREYENTRHNIGFRAIDVLASSLKDYFKTERSDKKYEALEYEILLGSQKQTVLLVKPLTFMNRSGEAVSFLVKKYGEKINIEDDLLVIHDELDVLVGRTKIGIGSSSAGHNGVQNIIDHLGTKNFARIRLGIMPEKGISSPVDEFVLQRFTAQEQSIIDQHLQTIPEIVECIFSKGIGEAQNRFNTKK